MQQTAHNHIFTTTKRKPAITTIQQIARNHVRKESLQSYQSNKQPTITYGKTACNHTNATNSPQSHTHTNIKLLAIRKSIHNYKKKAQSHFCRVPTITFLSSTCAQFQIAKRPQTHLDRDTTQTCLLWTTMFPTINTQV